jgi:hypothetical protein
VTGDAARLHVPVAVQRLHVRCEIAWTDIVGGCDGVLAHVVDEISKIPPVRGQRGDRQAAFDAKPRQEVTYRLVEAAHAMTP